MTKIVKRSVSARCVFAAQFAQLSASALLTEWIWMRKWRPFSNLEMWITGTIQSINSGRISICKYRKVQEFYETLRWSDEESSDLSEEEDLSFMLPTLWTMALTFLWIASSALIVYIKCSILWLDLFVSDYTSFVLSRDRYTSTTWGQACPAVTTPDCLETGRTWWRDWSLPPSPPG